MFLYSNQVTRSNPHSKRLTYNGYLHTVLYFLAPCPSFFYTVLVVLAIYLHLALPYPILSYKSPARRVLSSKRRRFIGSSSKDKVVVLQVNIVKRAVKTRDSIAVITYYNVIGIYSNNEVLAIIEAIQDVRR